MADKTLLEQIRTEAKAIAPIQEAWFVKDAHRVAAARLVDFAERAISRASNLQEELDKKSKDFAKIKEWREQAEQSQKTAAAARSQLTKLERRVTALEKELADTQTAADAIKAKARQQISSMEIKNKELVGKLENEREVHKQTETQQLNELKSLQSKLLEANQTCILREAEVDRQKSLFSAVAKSNHEQEKEITSLRENLVRLQEETQRLETDFSNKEAERQLLQERLDAIDLHAVAIHGIVVEKAMAECAEAGEPACEGG